MPFDSAFVARWSTAPARERAHYQHFFVELCDFLDVPRPDPSAEHDADHGFRHPVTIFHADGRETTGRIDFFRAGCFVVEAKQASGIAADGVMLEGSAPGGIGSGQKVARAAHAEGERHGYLGRP